MEPPIRFHFHRLNHPTSAKGQSLSHSFCWYLYAPRLQLTHRRLIINGATDQFIREEST